MSKFRQPAIKSFIGRGRGVVATQNYISGEIIETCPVIPLSKKERAQIDPTVLYNYYFNWTDEGAALALGYGSLYNHSYQPNALYERDYSTNQIIFRSYRPIHAGEEITVNYNNNPEDTTPVWFDTQPEQRGVANE